MKVGDYVIFKDELTEILFEDLDGDLWCTTKGVEGTKGNSFKRIKPAYFTLEILEKLDDNTSYFFLSTSDIERCKVINLTKLTKKVYNLPEDFKGNIYLEHRRK